MLPCSPTRRALHLLGLQAAVALSLAAALPAADAAEPIFRCGKTYTNVQPGAGRGPTAGPDCVLLEPVAPSSARTPRIAVDGSRALTVPVGTDGRFRVPGAVNGFPVQFVLDRDAALHAGALVSEDFAAKANLIGGMPVHVRTGGGDGGGTAGRRIEGVPMRFGPFLLRQPTVVVDSLGGRGSAALLGQDLLSLFEVTVNEREMTIVAK